MQKYITEITEKRKKKGLSIMQLCKLANITVFDYLQFLGEKGISFENFNKLRDALGMISVSDELLMQTI